jgi:site-specific DNA-methyltransferase (adenine-specific)
MTATMLHGDCLNVLRQLAKDGVTFDHTIMDPPYDEHTHKAQRRAGSLPDAKGPKAMKCKGARTVSLGFDHITKKEIRAVSKLVAAVTKRWVLVFSNVELVHEWRAALKAAGLEPLRVMAWVKDCATPQFSGDRPAQGFECIIVAHKKGRKKWNAGGKLGVYAHSIVVNRGGKNKRLHTTPKPLGLMIDLVRDFTNYGDRILDPYAGSATTGIAAMRMGRAFLGVEKKLEYVETARERIEAELRNLTIQEFRKGKQLPLLST